MITEAIIGLNYGDEGKGQMVYEACRAAAPNKVIVVRYNGGAQAGHTVKRLGSNSRQVYHSFGAGSDVGADTYLSRHFVFEPDAFIREAGNVPANGMDVYLDPRCLLATPFDVYFNRRESRYNSAAVGFGEALERSKVLPIFAYDSVSAIEDKLRCGITDYFEQKLRDKYNETMDDIQGTEWGFLTQPFWVQTYCEQWHVIMDRVKLRCPDFSEYENVVFEGAQGLALDQNRGEFPDVTRSNTGLTNVVDICRDFLLPNPRIKYVTRAYLTRHGRGKLDGVEGEEMPAGLDETNATNKWQGALRWAPLNFEAMAGRIEADTDLYTRYWGRRLTVTCGDHLQTLGYEEDERGSLEAGLATLGLPLKYYDLGRQPSFRDELGKPVIDAELTPSRSGWSRVDWGGSPKPSCDSSPCETGYARTHRRESPSPAQIAHAWPQIRGILTPEEMRSECPLRTT